MGSLKKYYFCWDLLLGQRWFKFYCAAIFSSCILSIGTWINWIRITTVINTPRLIRFPIVKIFFSVFSFQFVVKKLFCSTNCTYTQAQTRSTNKLKLSKKSTLWLTLCYCIRALSSWMWKTSTPGVFLTLQAFYQYHLCDSFTYLYLISTLITKE